MRNLARWAALAAAACLAASCASRPAAPSAGPGAAGLVPWSGRPAGPYADLAPPKFRADARPCQAADLSGRPGRTGVGLGNTNLEVLLTNRSGSACLLTGRPAIAGITAAGTVTPLHAGRGSYFGDPGPVANIGSGQTAAVNVSSSDACQVAQDGRHQRYRLLRIWLHGRGHLDVRAAGFDLICGVFVSRFGVPADQPRAPRPSPLTARITAAATVRPGEDFTYTVTLANPTTSAYSLRPCPAYEEYIIANAGLTKSPAPDSRVVANYYLNCATVHQIGAHGSVTYQMRLKLPTGFPAGPVKFVWLLHGGAGPGASAPLKVTGKS
jgi:hypothetical protein